MARKSSKRPATATQDGWTRPDFSSPRCRYESVAYITNAQGQQFEMWVRSAERAAMRQYMEEVQVKLEVLEATPDQKREEAPRSSKTETNLPTPDQNVPETASQPEEQSPDEESKGDREITIRVVNTKGIVPPYILRFTIDPTIIEEDVRRNKKDIYDLNSTDSTDTVTITAQQGILEAKLFRAANGSTVAGPVSVDVIANNDFPQTNSLTRGDVVGPVKARVAGKATGQNRYTIEGEITMSVDQ